MRGPRRYAGDLVGERVAGGEGRGGEGTERKRGPTQEEGTVGWGCRREERDVVLA